MAQDVASLSGEDCFEGKSPCCSDSEAASQGDKDYDDILELNQFDGLPYSSRFYKLLEERKELPVWRAKGEFMNSLAKGQFVVVRGFAKSGRSSQVSGFRMLDDTANESIKIFIKPNHFVTLFIHRFLSGVLNSACQSSSSMVWWSALRFIHSRQ